MLSKTSTNTNNVGACATPTRLDASLSLKVARQSATRPETSQVVATAPSQVPVQTVSKSFTAFSAEQKSLDNFSISNSSYSVTSLTRCATTMRGNVDQQMAEKFSHLPVEKSISEEISHSQQASLSSEPNASILSRRSVDHHKLNSLSKSTKMTPVPRSENPNTNLLQRTQTIPESKNVQRLPNLKVDGCESRKRKHESAYKAAPVFSSVPRPIQFMCTVGEPVLMQDLMDQELPIVKRKNLFYRPALRALEDNSIQINIMSPSPHQIIQTSPTGTTTPVTPSGAHLIKFQKTVPNVEIRR